MYRRETLWGWVNINSYSALKIVLSDLGKNIKFWFLFLSCIIPSVCYLSAITPPRCGNSIVKVISCGGPAVNIPYTVLLVQWVNHLLPAAGG
jgi:hypothetical protein